MAEIKMAEILHWVLWLPLKLVVVWLWGISTLIMWPFLFFPYWVQQHWKVYRGTWPQHIRKQSAGEMAVDCLGMGFWLIGAFTIHVLTAVAIAIIPEKWRK